MKTTFALTIALALFIFPACAGPAHAAALRSGASFLKIGTGARPAALGGAYTALAQDVDALYYNPAGLASLEMKELGATHTEYLLDTKFDFLGYAHPTQLGTFGFGMTRLSSAGFEGRNANRQTTGDFTATDEAYALSFARGMTTNIPGKTGAGASLKLLRSSIAGYSAQTVALDLGVQHRLNALPLSIGASILNIGQGMQFLNQRDPLPLSFALGAAYRLGGLFDVAIDLKHEPNDRRTDIGLGTEYALFRGFSVRAGYATSANQTTGASGPLAGLGGGFGLKMRNYRADYTFTPFGDLGNVQRLSLGARW